MTETAGAQLLEVGGVTPCGAGRRSRRAINPMTGNRQSRLLTCSRKRGGDPDSGGRLPKS